MDHQMAGSSTTALVTGAASGIGSAVARSLATEAARVICLDSNEAGLAATVRAIESAGGHASAVTVDVTDAAAIAQLVASPLLDGLEQVALCAGIYRSTPVDSFTLESYREVIDVNLTASVGLLMALAPRLREATAGRVVTISSIHADFAEQGSSAYAISKAGLVAATRALAIDLAADGVLVNSIAPGFIDTPMAILADGASEFDTERFSQVYLDHAKLPLGRPGTPDEVAAAARFLLSADNGYITGHVLVVDGGLTATF